MGGGERGERVGSRRGEEREGKYCSCCMLSFIAHDKCAAAVPLCQSWHAISARGCFYLSEEKGEDPVIKCHNYKLNLPSATTVWMEISRTAEGVSLCVCVLCVCLCVVCVRVCVVCACVCACMCVCTLNVQCDLCSPQWLSQWMSPSLCSRWTLKTTPQICSPSPSTASTSGGLAEWTSRRDPMPLSPTPPVAGSKWSRRGKEPWTLSARMAQTLCSPTSASEEEGQGVVMHCYTSLSGAVSRATMPSSELTPPH